MTDSPVMINMDKHDCKCSIDSTYKHVQHEKYTSCLD